MTGRDQRRSNVRSRTVGAPTDLEAVQTRGLALASVLVVALHAGVVTLAWAGTALGGDTLVAALAGAALALATQRVLDRVGFTLRRRYSPT